MSVAHWNTHDGDTACGVKQTKVYSADDVTCRQCLVVKSTEYIFARERLAKLDRETASTIPPTYKMTFPAIVIKDYFANPDHSALLLRAASFLADLPSGSLDRVRNVEAMNLIRALRDAVVPADKVRK